jgi:hypothetical protein
MEEIIKSKKELSKEIERLINEFMSKHGGMGIDIETLAFWDGNKKGKKTYKVNVSLSI